MMEEEIKPSGTSRWKVIGISGATNSGKSSLSNCIISQRPGSVWFLQDDYFHHKDSDRHVIIPELNHQNWECLQSINWESLMINLGEQLEQEPTYKDALFLVDGHIIYNYPSLEKLFDKKYFLTLSEEECFKRRSVRVYDPPDCPGYFENCIWPMYLSNLEDIKNNCSDVVYIDGTHSMEAIFKVVLTDLTKSYGSES